MVAKVARSPEARRHAVWRDAPLLQPDVLHFRLRKTGETRSFTAYFQAAPFSRVCAIKAGIPAVFVEEIAAEMGNPRKWLLKTLGIPVAACNRKRGESRPLSKAQGELVLGIARLIGQVEAMVAYT